MNKLNLYWLMWRKKVLLKDLVHLTELWIFENSGLADFRSTEMVVVPILVEHSDRHTSNQIKIYESVLQGVSKVVSTFKTKLKNPFLPCNIIEYMNISVKMCVRIRSMISHRATYIENSLYKKIYWYWILITRF